MLTELSVKYSIISNFYRLLLHQNRNLETASFMISEYFTSHNIIDVTFLVFHLCSISSVILRRCIAQSSYLTSDRYCT